MNTKRDVFNVLFLCTGNSARSVMAEALLNRKGAPRFKAYSAGSRPGGEVNPNTLRLLSKLKFNTDGLRSKSWDEFALKGAPTMDLVITVCDNAAGEICPIWPGHPLSAHWGFPDPAAATGSDAEVAAVFTDVFAQIEQRIDTFINLPFSALDNAALKKRIGEIGTTQEIEA